MKKEHYLTKSGKILLQDVLFRLDKIKEKENGLLVLKTLAQNECAKFDFVPYYGETDNIVMKIFKETSFLNNLFSVNKKDSEEFNEIFLKLLNSRSFYNIPEFKNKKVNTFFNKFINKINNKEKYKIGKLVSKIKYSELNSIKNFTFKKILLRHFDEAFNEKKLIEKIKLLAGKNIIFKNYFFREYSIIKEIKEEIKKSVFEYKYIYYKQFLLTIINLLELESTDKDKKLIADILKEKIKKNNFGLFYPLFKLSYSSGYYDFFLNFRIEDFDFTQENWLSHYKTLRFYDFIDILKFMFNDKELLLEMKNKIFLYKNFSPVILKEESFIVKTMYNKKSKIIYVSEKINVNGEYKRNENDPVDYKNIKNSDIFLIASISDTAEIKTDSFFFINNKKEIKEWTKIFQKSRTLLPLFYDLYIQGKSKNIIKDNELMSFEFKNPEELIIFDVKEIVEYILKKIHLEKNKKEIFLSDDEIELLKGILRFQISYNFNPVFIKTENCIKDIKKFLKKIENMKKKLLSPADYLNLSKELKKVFNIKEFKTILALSRQHGKISKKTLIDIILPGMTKEFKNLFEEMNNSTFSKKMAKIYLNLTNKHKNTEFFLKEGFLGLVDNNDELIGNNNFFNELNAKEMLLFSSILYKNGIGRIIMNHRSSLPIVRYERESPRG